MLLKERKKNQLITFGCRWLYRLLFKSIGMDFPTFLLPINNKSSWLELGLQLLLFRLVQISWPHYKMLVFLAWKSVICHPLPQRSLQPAPPRKHSTYARRDKSAHCVVDGRRGRSLFFFSSRWADSGGVNRAGASRNSQKSGWLVAR